MNLIASYLNHLRLTVIALCCFSPAVFGQLTGTKKIPGDYATITSAVNALNTAGAGTGGVVFSIAAGHTETIAATIALTATGTAANPIVFQKDPASSGENPLITAYINGVGTPATAVQDGIWRLSGSDYVTIDGIDLTDNPANTSNPSTMEYGYALYKASTSNGCQYVTIKNCTITLNNINNAAGTYPMVDGSTGIIVMNAVATAAVSNLTPTAGGTNSYNKFYSNTIQNCNTGIALSGYAAASPFTLADTNNDVGGTSTATGDTVVNFGGAAAAANAAAAIRTASQYVLNVSYNLINNNNGSGTNHPNVLRGIYINAATSADADVTFNTITLSGGGTTHNISAIENAAGSTAAGNTINISNNIIINCTYSTATTGGFYGINNAASPATLLVNANNISNNASAATTTGFLYGIYNSGTAAAATMNGNSFSGNSTSTLTTGLFCGIFNAAAVTNLTINTNTLAGNVTSAVSGAYYAIYNSAKVSGAININANNIGTGVSQAITFNAANSGVHNLIYNAAGASASTLSISNNNIQGINYAVTGTASNVFILNSAATLSQNISNNSFTGLNVNTSGNVTFISNNVVATASGVQNINGNAIAGTFTKAAGGTVLLFTSSATSVAGSTINYNNNNFSNITVTGATVLTGWSNTDAGAPVKTIQNNTFSNWVAGTGTVTAMSINITGANNSTTGNLINNISGAGTVTAIVTATGNDNIFSNTINTLSTTGASSVTGIAVTGGTTKNIYGNKIYDLQATNVSGTAYGITVSGTTTAVVTANVYNNLIGDLRTPIASGSDPVRGINITSTRASSSINVYYNTVYLNAGSTGTSFGATGIYHSANATATTAALTLRNNIITNLSVPSGSGLVVAYRRSSTAIGNYASASNNNLFYSGPPSTSRLIFYDGTNSDQTLTAFKSRVSPTDAASVTEDLITSSKFLSTTGSSASYLHLDPSKATLAESGGVNIANFTADVDAQIRQGNTGYPGTGTAPDIGADEFDGIRSTALSGTVNVGSGQAYTSLTNAGGLFAGINSLGLSGNLTVNITSDLTEDGTNILNLWSETGIGNYTLTIQPNASTLRTISGNVLAGMIRLNGAKRVTINGSNGTTGNYLTFRNTNTAGTTGTAVTFINGATGNAIRYCNIEAYTNATNGAILFSSSTVAGGNSNNTISNCNINATVSGNTGNVAIYSAGTAGKENAANIISNNNIYNYRDRGLDIPATGSLTWTISGNSFYNGDVTGSINYAAASVIQGIRILGGTGYAVLNNYIGGNAPLATGTSAVYSSTLGVLTFQGILLTTTGATPASNIKGNTIATMSVSAVPNNATTILSVFAGIETGGSGINIGGALAGEGNMVGSNTTNGSIVITTTTALTTHRSYIRGINCTSTGGLIIGNQVGSLDIKNIGAGPAPSTFYAIFINAASAPTQVNNNIVGSNGTGAALNSIRVLSSSTSATTTLSGIWIGASVTSTMQVGGNIVQNLSYQNTTASGSITGIANTATTTAVVTITGNTINSNTTNASTGGFYGIYSNAAPATLTINNNSVTANVSTATGAGFFYGIFTSGSGGSVIVVSNNNFSGNTTAALTTGLFVGIYNSATPASLAINSNLLYGNTTTSTSGAYYAIYNSGAVTTTININSNNIGSSISSAITYNAANSAIQYFINNTGGAGTAALSISNNDFQGINYAVAGTGNNYYVLNSAATLSQAINGNTFTNLNVNTSGNITFISDNVVLPASGTQNVNNNKITGSFTKRAGGTLTLFTSGATSVTGSVTNNNSNNFSNITVTGATTVAGWINTDAGNTSKTIQNNTFTNWSCGSSAVTVLSVNLSGTNNATAGNIINNITGTGAVTAITTAVGNDNIYSNTINTLSTTGSAAVTAITVTAGTTKNIYKNKIYDLSSSSATGSINAILVSGGTTVNIYNNLIGDLRIPAANSTTDLIRAVNITSATASSAINVYYNTIYVNASSTGTNFSTSAIYHTVNATATTAALNLRNNSITNISTPKGSGNTVVFRRSGNALNNYASTSNNNLFYAGAPSTTRLIFSDGTNSDQTLSAYKTRVTTRDASSVTEDLTAKFLSIAGASSVFLHINASIANTLESAAANISGYTDDFDGQIRAGNSGYSGTSSTPDIGADEIFGIETVPPSISYTLLDNATTVTNRSVTGVTISDASGINNTAGTRPRLYYKRSGDANLWLDNTSSTNGWKYTEATTSVSPYSFLIDYSLLNGGATVTAGVIQYFIVAQDLATTANIALNSGTFAVTPVSVALTSTAFPIGGTINSYNIPFSGSYNIGSTEVFTSFTKAGGVFASINSAGLMGNITFNVTSDLAEDGLNALNQWTESGAGNYTFTIQPDAASLRTISGNVASGLIRLNGADRVTIDGSNGSSGIYLRFKNTNTTGATGTAFTFINGATNNTIRYCEADAYANAVNGVILFSTSSVTGGNSNNLVDNCDLNATVGVNSSNVGIYSAGTVGNENSSNTISNNDIFDYKDRGIDITATGSTAWTISGNSLYNGDASANINYAASSALHGIRVLGGSGYNIIDNDIGGHKSQASGANAVYSSTSGTLSYYGILLTTSSATPASYIRSNTITAVSIVSVPTAAGSIAFTGIETNGSGINAGGAASGDGNIIGSNTVNGAVTVTTSTTSIANTSLITGINFVSANGLVTGNQVGGIDINNIGSAPAPSLFQGLFITNSIAPSQVNNNIIGSAGIDAISNSIRVLPASTALSTTLNGIATGAAVASPVEIKGNVIQNISNLSTTSSGSFTGISNTASSSNATVTIGNDTIKYITTAAGTNMNSTVFTGIASSSPSVISNNIIDHFILSATGTGAQVRGIYVSGAFIYIISDNLLSAFITASTKTADIETDAPSGYTITGILNDASVSGQVISNNVLTDFSSTTQSAVNTAVTGIGVTGAASGDIFNNRISKFSNTATGGSMPGISGITAANGSFNVYNNAIKFNNSAYANGVKLYGINHAAATNWNYFYNSVSISGSSTAVTRSAAFIRTLAGNTVLKNNVLVNTRTGSGANYAISNIVTPPASGWSPAASNYNIFYSSNINATAEWGNGSSRTFEQWKTASGGDNNSVRQPVSFIVSDYDLQPDTITNCALNNSGTPIATPVSITTDIRTVPRSVTRPDPGAYEFNYAGFTIDAGSDAPVCSGDSVALTVNPGIALNPIYSWSNPANVVISTLQNPNVATVAGQYKVKVTDINGCFVTDSTLVLINQRPTASLSVQKSVCDSGMVSLKITVAGAGTISGVLNTGEIFSGTAPLITIPFSVLTTTYYSISSLEDDNCAAISSGIADTVAVLVTHKGDWLGVTNNWKDTVNWCGGIIPTSTTDVTIPAGTSVMPVITTSVACNNLIINTRDTVTVAATGTLNISGTLTNYGVYKDNGTTNFNGVSGQQTFSGATVFNNLTLGNTNGLLLPDTIFVTNNLTITSGTLQSNNRNIRIRGNWINNSSVSAFAPGTATVIFNSAASQSIGGTFATTFNNLITTNAAGIVTLNVNANIAGNLSVFAGTLDLAGFTANRVTSGGVLTVSNNSTLKIGGTNTYPANYATNTLVVAGTVEYSGANQTVANQSYGNLTLSSSGGAAVKTLPGSALTVVGNLSTVLGAGTSVTLNAASNLTVNGNVSIGASTIFNGGSYSHYIGGNWNNNGAFNGSTGTITFAGSGTSVSGAGSQNFNDLIVAAPSVTFSSGSITLTGSLGTSGSGSFQQSSGGTLLMTGAGKTISGSGISPDNLTISGSITTSSSFTVTGNLSVSGSFTASNGTVTMSGASKTFSGTGTASLYNLSITGSITSGSDFSIASGLIVYGSFTATTGTATFTGTSSLSGTANLYNVVINGVSLQPSSGSVLGVSNNLTIMSGMLDVTAGVNTVNFNGTGTQNVNSITYSNLVLSNGNTKTAAGGVTTNYNITIGTGTVFNASSYTHSIYGNWVNNGTFIAGTGTVQFLGPATSYISGNTTFNTLTSNTTNSTTQLLLQSNVSAATVNMTNGIISTGLNTLTITSTRTGNGIILGNIQRTHSFITGVAYAFEGPDNTITFSAVSSVSSVTVSVTEGIISDFPFGGSISRAYNITVPAGSYTATLRLHYNDDELNGNNETSMALWRYNGSAWGSIGKTANNTVSNYVEQNALTNITGRWTLSDNSNLVQWNGSVSTDWNTAANWTVTQGSGSRPPAASDIVDLGAASFVNQPTISTNVTVKNIIFESAHPVILTLAAGGSLYTLGDINGKWTGNAAHTINVNNQTLNVSGSINLSDGINGHAVNLNIGSGTVTTSGSVIETGGANINVSGTGTLSIAQDFNYTSGTFTPGIGTVLYNGAENQNIANVTYNNLTINKAAGLSSINDTVNISGILLISSGELDNYSAINVTGDVTINSGATLTNSNVMHVKGSWNNSGTYLSVGGSVFFDGTGTQNIASTTFNNLTINKSSGKALLTGDVVITGNLIVSAGTLDIQTYACNRNLPGGITTLVAGATMMIGANNPPKYFYSYSIDPASTTIMYGTTAQLIDLPGITFGNLIFRDAGIKTLSTSMTVNGNLTIENLSSFNAGSGTITLNGSWINNGTFNPSTGTVLWNGSSKVISGNATFNKVTVTGSYTILNDVTFNTLLNITSAGSLSGGSSIHTTLHGDLINSGTLYTLGTTTYSGNVVQTLSLINAVQTVALTVNFNGSVSPVLNSTSAPQFGYLNINNTGGINPSVGWTILYALTIANGASFNGGNAAHNIMGALTNNGIITSSGTLNFLPSSNATVNLGTNFSSTGTVVFGGAGQMTVTGTPASLRDVLISNTNTAGITSSANWLVTNNFSITNNAKFNAGTYSYTVGGNINNAGTLNRQTSTFILNGAAVQNVYSSSTSTFNHLTIQNTSGMVTLSSDVAVYGIMNFISGRIKTAANNVYISSTGSVTGAGQGTGWVNGNLQKNIATGASITRTFEVGDSLNYTPVAVLLASVTASGDLNTKTIASDHPRLATSEIDSSKTVNRYFTITNNGTAFTNAAITFHWMPADVDTGATTSAFRVKSYNGSAWTLLNSASPLPTSINATGVNAFGDFAIGQLTLAIWTGSLNTDWFTAANWSSGVPVIVTNATIPASVSNYPVVNSGTAFIQNITLESGASLTVNGAVLQISGVMSNNGNLTVSNGTIEMNGNIIQRIPAHAFTGNTIKNLKVNNNAGVILEDTLLLTGVLKLSAGNITTGGHLVLMSSAAATALIDGSGSGEVSGTVTMQRYLASGFGYKYLSSPFQAATVNEFSDDVDLGASFPSFYRYEENRPSSGWVRYTDTTGLLNPCEGYAANLGTSVSPKTIAVKGVVNNNSVSSPVLYNHNMSYTQGFHLAGNPYPSPIDWDAASGWSRNNIDNAVYYFNTSAASQYTGTYSTYINGVSSDGVAGNVIAAMQGFFVHVSNGAFPVSGSLMLNNTARVNNLVPDFHRRSSTNLPLIRLSAGYEEASTVADPLVIYFEDAATAAFDKDKDALKLFNTDSLVPNLYAIASDAAKLSIGGWPSVADSNFSIPLGLTVQRAGMISFNARQIVHLPSGVYIYLLDAASNTYYDLKQQPVFNMYLKPSEYTNRFSIVFRKEAAGSGTAIAETFTADNAGPGLLVKYKLASGEKSHLTVVNIQGQVVYRQELSGEGMQQVGGNLISGVYLVNLTTKRNIFSKKVYIGY